MSVGAFFKRVVLGFALGVAGLLWVHLQSASHSSFFVAALRWLSLLSMLPFMAVVFFLV